MAKKMKLEDIEQWVEVAGTRIPLAETQQIADAVTASKPEFLLLRQVVCVSPVLRHIVSFDLEAARMMAATSPHKPVGYEHDRQPIGHLDQGTILATEIVELEDGRIAIVDLQRIDGEWALKQFATGRVYAQSIEWDHLEGTRFLCDQCLTPFGEGECYHWPWESTGPGPFDYVRILISGQAMRRGSGFTILPASDGTIARDLQGLNLSASPRLGASAIDSGAETSLVLKALRGYQERPMATKPTDDKTTETAPAELSASTLLAENEQLRAQLQASNSKLEGLSAQVEMLEQSETQLRSQAACEKLQGKLNGELSLLVSLRSGLDPETGAELSSEEVFDRVVALMPDRPDLGKGVRRTGPGAEPEGEPDPKEVAARMKRLRAEDPKMTASQARKRALKGEGC